MEELQRRGWGNEHALDRLTCQEIRKIPYFGIKAIEMVKEARGLGGPTEIDLTQNTELDNLIFGEPEEGDEKGRDKIKLTIPLPARHIDWLKRLSVHGQELNPHIKEQYTVEMLVRKFILNARAKDETDAGRRTRSTTNRR